MREGFKQKKGITLIALVITIIVLLILAGISISMLSGDNSILQRATDAKQISERAEAKEQAQMDIMAYIADKTANHQDASLNDDKVKEILSDNKSYVKTANATSFITKKGEYEIPYSELYTKKNNNEDKTDLTKLQEYYSKGWDVIINQQTNAYQDVENVDIDSSKIHELYYYDNEPYFILIEYKNSLYSVAQDSLEVSYENVDLDTFGIKSINGANILVTPSTPDNLLHSDYTYYNDLYVLDETTQTFTILTPIYQTQNPQLHYDATTGQVIPANKINFD